MKPTERFSTRVANYLLYRPSYPVELINDLEEKCKLTSQSVIADIGSGTGKLTELFLSKGYSVHGVEPNKEMRDSAEQLINDEHCFTSVNGESDNTGLKDNSVDLVCAAQAFHWFEPVSTKKEFQRILKPGGHAALIWNKRDTETDFQQAYHQMLTDYCPEYSQVNHHTITDTQIEKFFHPTPLKRRSFANAQNFNQQGFLGRMCSSSYTPLEGTEAHDSLCNAAKALFKKYAVNDNISFSYKTNLYCAEFPMP